MPEQIDMFGACRQHNDRHLSCNERLAARGWTKGTTVWVSGRRPIYDEHGQHLGDMNVWECLAYIDEHAP